MYKKFIFYIILLVSFNLILFSLPAKAITENPPHLSAISATVIDVETGQVLYDKAMNLKKQPASLTKILTAIIAIEEGNLADIVTISRKAAYQEGSSIYLLENEKISLEELIYGAMLESGNDACVAIAEHISGSVEEFANLMNKRAREMGAQNSNFKNPNGLPHNEHYSTAYDLAVLMRYALHNKKFAEITATKYKTISWGDNSWGRKLRNHNELLWMYPGITGGKTGYTRAAGRCLISSAEKNGREVVAVVLKSNSDWDEVSKLLTYGLNNFKRVQVVKEEQLIDKLTWEKSKEGSLSILTQQSIAAVGPTGGKIKFKKEIKLKTELILPINKGDLLGELIVSVDGKQIGKTALIAGNDLNYNSIFLRFWTWLTDKFTKE